ncbi:hypothetical protein HNY73_012071 [Argiope bruennichi]|uniref:Uncharacterized protein n=1 Tax=Argiope bruennichi TaxID=94029 RepID=A0A8T0EVC8_ARGBR|nr:hypothetical protein HNY73_012071 [Argiope bruennichi]
MADLIDKVNDLVRSDRWVTMRMLVVNVDVSVGTIVQDRLRYRKLCAQWVPKELTDQHKELRMGLALQHLFPYHEDPAFLEWIITGNESWCHNYEPERDSMQWKHTSSPLLKNSKPWRQQARCDIFIIIISVSSWNQSVKYFLACSRTSLPFYP